MMLLDGRLSQEDMRLLEANLLVVQGNSQFYKNYLIGYNPTLMNAPAKDSPDNRVPVPFAKRIVSTLKGYAYKPGYITYSAPEEYMPNLKDVFDLNDEELHTAELADDAMGYGVGYEILRIDDSLRIRQYRVEPGDGIMAYDNTIEKKPIAFIHLVTHDDYSQTKTIYYADVYQTWYRSYNGNWGQMEEVEHPFGMVPVVAYRMNRFNLPIYSSVLKMIDEHDKVISSAYANERERFAQAYLLLMDELSETTDSDGRTVIDRLAEIRAFTGLGRNGTTSRVQDAVAYLTKPARGTEAAEEADRLERLIKENAQIIDPYDASFSGASGIALAYKLLPMEWLCADMDGYFDRALQDRIMLIQTAQKVLSGIAPEMVTIHHRRNIPMDLLNLADLAGRLKGILSDRTILELFPADVVADVEEELTQIEEQAGSLFDTQEPQPEEAIIDTGESE